MPVSIAEPSLDNVSLVSWEKLSDKRIFFGHQSVGYNILDGVGIILKEHPEIHLKIVETSDPTRFDAPIFANAPIGRNGNPGSKCEAFERFLDDGIGKWADIAFFKFCFVDVNRDTDVEKMFEQYRATIRSVKKKYPALTIVHLTVPLVTSDYGLISRLKGIIKGLLGRKSMDANVNRYRMNELIRKEYAGKDPVFDLASIESITPTGEPVTFVYDGKGYPSLYPGYTTDGGHLNDIGKRLVGMRLLVFLADIAEKEK